MKKKEDNGFTQQTACRQLLWQRTIKSTSSLHYARWLSWGNRVELCSKCHHLLAFSETRAAVFSQSLVSLQCVLANLANNQSGVKLIIQFKSYQRDVFRTCRTIYNRIESLLAEYKGTKKKEKCGNLVKENFHTSEIVRVAKGS